MTKDELITLIDFEREMLKTWEKRVDMSLMPSGWSVTSQRMYLNDLYKKYYELDNNYESN